MRDFDRRSSVALGLATATAALTIPQTATAETRVELWFGTNTDVTAQPV